jgi:putative transposase
MARKSFTTEQISQALRNLDAGTAVIEITRKLGVHENTLYRWKKQYGDLGTPEIRELRLLRDENTKLQQIVADLSLDRKMLQDVLSKKW